MPPGRAPSVAIGTVAQFEQLLLRQMDIIGERAPITATRNDPAGIATLDLDAERWGGLFRLGGTAGWRWRMKTSKSKYRSAGRFRPHQVHAGFCRCLRRDPLEERAGAIVKGAKGLPVRRDMHARLVSAKSRAPRVSRTKCGTWTPVRGRHRSRRSGRRPLRQSKARSTHTKESTTLRYLRRGRSKKITLVAEARSNKTGVRRGRWNKRKQPHAQNRCQNQKLKTRRDQMVIRCGREDSNLHGLPR